MTLRYDIIMCTKDRPDDIKKAFGSIIAQTFLPSKIIVIDASKDSLTHDFLNKFSLAHPTLRLHYEKSPIASSTHQRNQGIRWASNPITFFIDDDVIWDSDHAETIIKKYEASPEIDAITGYEVNHGGMSRHYLFFCWFFGLNIITKTRGSYIRYSGFSCYSVNGDKELKEEFLCTCTCSIRRKLLETYRFDERLNSYAYMEDLDWSIPIGRKHTIIRLPGAKYRHYPSTRSRISRTDFQTRYVFNHYHIFKKHIRKDSLHLIAFFWSNIGLLIEATLNSIKYRQIGCLSGTFKAFSLIIKDLFSHK